MKTMTVAEAQGRLQELIKMVAAGEEVQLTDDQHPVAKLVPPEWEGARVNWADTWAKVDAVFEGQPAPGTPGSQIVTEGRR